MVSWIQHIGNNYPGVYWEGGVPSIFCEVVWEDVERVRSLLADKPRALAEFNRKVEWFRQEDLRQQILFEAVEDIHEMSEQTFREQGLSHPLIKLRSIAAEFTQLRYRPDSRVKGLSKMPVRQIILAIVGIIIFLGGVLLIALRSR